MRRILNFGSMNIDNVYTVEHFVRPGETISSLEMEVFPGGKGLNQTVALARAGAEVYHAGKIGKDGRFLLDLLRSAGADISFVETINGYTGKAIIQVEAESGQNCILLYNGANYQMTELFIDEVLGSFSADTILVLQNEINLVEYIIDRASAKGMQIALNPSPIRENLSKCDLSKITWLLLNEIEGKALTGETEPEKIAGALLAEYPDMKVVLTLGGDGVYYCDQNESFRYGVYQTEVVDTTAAGDTFAGYFLACSARGMSPQMAVEEASRASALAISKQGAAVSIPVRIEVLHADLKLRSECVE